MHKHACPICNGYMIHVADQYFPHHPNRWLKCSCGYTVASGDYLPPEPTEEQIKNILLKVE